MKQRQTGTMTQLLLRLLGRSTQERGIMAAAAIISITLFTFTVFPKQARSLLSYTKAVTWDTLFMEPRLKSFYLTPQQQAELYDCQYSRRDESQCPSYFAWLHEDLAPWNDTGITQELMAESRARADYRVVIVGGKLYYEQYHKCFQTRDDYTLWGLLMLVQRFPEEIPDLELYFVCGDYPQFRKTDYSPGARWPPPPMFAYDTFRKVGFYDLILPDWSFWAWPEVNIQPWTEQLKIITKGAASTTWFDRKPLAYWKGNVWVGTPVRTDLLQCNDTNRFNLLVYHQDWKTEDPFKSSGLAEQCNYRFKVYAEGTAWSVSQKYIFACASTVLHIEPEFWEFFARSWLPYVHYWPLSRSKMCSSIKYAVDWGNAHPAEAGAIGRCGKAFVEKELTMDYVYDYMLHLLQGYGKLFKYKPVPPEGVQPMSLDSKLPWHELSLPPNGTASKRKKRKICSMPPRDKAAIDRIVARQEVGYLQASRQE